VSERDSSQPGAASSRKRPAPGLAVSVRTDAERLYVRLDDGREVSMPLTARLRAATPAQREAWEIDDGTDIHWEEADEDIGVNALIGITEAEVYEYAGYDRYDETGRLIPAASSSAARRGRARGGAAPTAPRSRRRS